MPWRDVIASAQVAPAAVVGVEVGGAELVVWRAVDGRVTVCDARCPHQWSHLAAEGAVDGDELVCLSHHWRFDAEGRGSKVNVKGRRDAKGDVAVFACRERDGRIEVEMTDLAEKTSARDDM
jgi:phenylpropionate dioxygenase-like ring-hydroxylating dioxygenase large terminal subunit